MRSWAVFADLDLAVAVAWALVLVDGGGVEVGKHVAERDDASVDVVAVVAVAEHTAEE